MKNREKRVKFLKCKGKTNKFFGSRENNENLPKI